MLPLVTAGLALIDKLVPDPQAKLDATAKLMQMEKDGELKELEAVMQIITAEANSEHWLAANWRPITMLTFVFIIANNYIIYPYLSLFWNDEHTLAIPPDMWALLKIGLGGYVVGRSVEKGIKNWKQAS